MSPGTTIKRGQYLAFMAIFWIAATGLMFLNALKVDHWDQVLIRFYYFPIVGLLISGAMTMVYQSDFFCRSGRTARLIWVVVISLFAATLTSTLLNPVTFLMLGLDIVARHAEMISSGIVFFIISYLFWSFLYLQLDGRPLLGPSPGSASTFIDRIGVEDRGKVQTIQATDVECFTASGDYVEIHTGDKTYLKKETILALEALLDPKQFFRVHRSAIVNSAHIKSIAKGDNGTFKLTLTSGRTVTSSRSYRSVVQSLNHTK